MRSGSRCPAFYGEIPPMRWGLLNDDGGYFYCITYTAVAEEPSVLPPIVFVDVPLLIVTSTWTLLEDGTDGATEATGAGKDSFTSGFISTADATDFEAPNIGTCIFTTYPSGIACSSTMRAPLIIALTWVLVSSLVTVAS